MELLAALENGDTKLNKIIEKDFEQRAEILKDVISSKNSRSDMQSRTNWSRDMNRTKGGKLMPGQWVLIADKQANKKLYRDSHGSDRFIVIRDGGKIVINLLCSTFLIFTVFPLQITFKNHTSID